MSSPQQPHGGQPQYPGQPQQPAYPQQPPQAYPQPGYPQQGQPWAYPQQAQQWGYPQQGYPQPPGTPNKPLIMTTAGLNIAIGGFLAIIGVILALEESGDLSGDEFILVATIIRFFSHLLMLGAAVLLITGAIQLFRSRRTGALFTLLGGAIGVGGGAVEFLGDCVWTKLYADRFPQYLKPPSLVDYLTALDDIIGIVLIAGLIPLVLGLLPALKRSLR